MSGKRTRVWTAASLVLSAGSLLGSEMLFIAKPVQTFAAELQAGDENAAANPVPAQAAQPPETGARQRQNQNAAANSYRPASAISAGDAQFPFQTAADGIVVFNVSLGPEGQIKKINVLQDIPPFTAAAEQSLRNWKFAAALQDGRPEDSEMLVSFVFRHAVYIADEPAFTPILPAKRPAEAREGFVPPGILSVSYAAYPASTIAMGAVVVQATVKADGSTGGVSVLRDLPGDFGKLAANAAKHWKFQPAMLDGKAVPSKVAIAFVFSSRALNPF